MEQRVADITRLRYFGTCVCYTGLITIVHRIRIANCPKSIERHISRNLIGVEVPLVLQIAILAPANQIIPCLGRVCRLSN